MKNITLAKGKNEKCGGLWNTSGSCASGLNCLKTLKPDPKQRVIRRESKTDSYSKGPTLFGLRYILCHNF